MPLYITDEAILAQFTNKEVIHGLRAIKLEASTIAITPALALRLIRRYLRPQRSIEGQRIFDKKRKTSWNGIYFLYVDLGFYSENDDDIWQLALAVKLIHSHTKRQPRDFEFSAIEENTFLQICGYLSISIKDIRHPARNRSIDPLRFCELCWRQPLPGRKLCGHHALSDPILSGEGMQKAASRYKAGIRQKELLEKIVNRILTQETIEFHESLFQAQIICPDIGIASWLAERRPAIWRELGSYQDTITDENAIQILLDILHKPEALPAQAKALYQTINAHIQSHPILIWPMLLRAEGWYQSCELMKSNRGGKRLGAGRPKQEKPDPTG